MIDYPLYMSYSPVMTDSIKDIFAYLDESCQVHFHFAGRFALTKIPPKNWKESGYHAISTLKSGGTIDTWFDNSREQRGNSSPPSISNLLVLKDTKQKKHTNEPYKRVPGDVCFFRINERRRIEVHIDDSDKGLELTVVALRITLFGNLDFLSFWNIPFLFDPEIGAALDLAIYDLIKLEELNSQKTELSPLLERKRLCFHILTLICRASTPRSNTFKRLKSYHRVQPAVELINKEFRDELKIPDLAKCCSLSRSQFHHNFKHITGSTPLDYQRKLRLDEAKRLLLQTDMNVSEISDASGWNDPFHFSRMFKKLTGASPSVFRNLNNNEGFAF